MNVSPTYISGIVTLIVFVAGLFKVSINQEGLTVLLTEVVGIIASIVILVRRYQKGDITILGKVKTDQSI
jgi:hypothetical protein